MIDIGSVEVVRGDLFAALAAEFKCDQDVPKSDAPPKASESYTSRLQVHRWLADRGVDFQVKREPDGRGRTVYVLSACPMDAGHASPDACIMQAPDGALSAKCFHASCSGHGWQAFKEAIGPPDPDHYDPPLGGQGKSTKAGANSKSAPLSPPPAPLSFIHTYSSYSVDCPPHWHGICARSGSRFCLPNWDGGLR